MIIKIKEHGQDEWETIGPGVKKYEFVESWIVIYESVAGNPDLTHVSFRNIGRSTQMQINNDEPNL